MNTVGATPFLVLHIQTSSLRSLSPSRNRQPQISPKSFETLAPMITSNVFLSMAISSNPPPSEIGCSPRRVSSRTGLALSRYGGPLFNFGFRGLLSGRRMMPGLRRRGGGESNSPKRLKTRRKRQVGTSSGWMRFAERPDEIVLVEGRGGVGGLSGEEKI